MIKAKNWQRGDTRKHQAEEKSKEKKSSTEKGKSIFSRNKQTNNSDEKRKATPSRPVTSHPITKGNDKHNTKHQPQVKYSSSSRKPTLPPLYTLHDSRSSVSVPNEKDDIEFSTTARRHSEASKEVRDAYREFKAPVGVPPWRTSQKKLLAPSKSIEVDGIQSDSNEFYQDCYISDDGRNRGIRHSPMRVNLRKDQLLPNVAMQLSRYHNISPTPPASPGRIRRKPLVETDTVHVEELPDGTQINQYKIGEELGRGSYGLVKVASNEDDHVDYAIKIISKVKMKKRAALTGRRVEMRKLGKVVDPFESIYREIAIMKKLNHKNIVQLIEVLNDTNNDYFYMVYELLSKGAVMPEIPTDNTFSEELSRRYFRDIVLGIEFLHFQGVIHRDIKPANLLLTEDNGIKIADFGVSELFEGSDAFVTKSAGTHYFMAPEAIAPEKAKSQRGKALDIWAMGITLFCFIYGRCPFQDVHIMQLFKKISTEPLRIPDDPYIDPQLEDLLYRLLVKNPSERITISKIKEHPWVTCGNTDLMPTTEDNCTKIVVTDEDITRSVGTLPHLSTLFHAKKMLREKSFRNPYQIGSQR